MSSMTKLYLKISFAFVAILTMIGIFYIGLSRYVAEKYLQETKQHIYGSLAKDIMTGVRPLLKEGVNENLVDHIMHFVRAINPDVDVYLLNPEGKVFTNISKEKNLELEQVDLVPIKSFIDAEKISFIVGDDPKDRRERKVFSAAKILNDEERLIGYVYVLLHKKENEIFQSGLMNSYITSLGVKIFVGVLFTSSIIGLLIIWLLTKTLRSYSNTVTEFKNGNLDIRVTERAKDDLPILGDTFNEMADEIAANITKLKSIEKNRKELMANVSHDLRTPIAVIQGYTETLMLRKYNIENTDRNKYLNIILKSTDKLSRLIDLLFEYTKLEANEIKPKLETFQITDLIYDVFSNYHVIAKEKDIKVNMELEEYLPLVNADIALMERVLQNLMDNALKFTPKSGQVSIRAKAKKDNIVLEIHNTGSVISTEEIPHIFNRYQKVNSKVNDGRGLGLAIVKKIVELHDAGIKVFSSTEEGTTFQLLLTKTILKKEKSNLLLV